MNIFQRWLNQKHAEIRKAKNVSIQLVRKFQTYRLSQGRAKRTIDNDVANLHTVFLWAKRENYVKSSPFDYSRHANIDLFDAISSPPAVYSHEEYLALIREADKAGDILIRDQIVVLASTGMRFG